MRASCSPVWRPVYSKSTIQAEGLPPIPEVIAAAGGQIVAEGRPEQVAKVTGSYTGRFLAGALMLAADNNGS
jgi:hypothetical protein